MMTGASEQRIKSFVDEFIRSEDVQGLTSDRDSDLINRRDRATRCYNAAIDGGDGKTHAEVIGDWRDAFKYWIRERRRCKDTADPDRFIAAVEAYFDDVELWHEKNGSLFKEIG